MAAKRQKKHSDDERVKAELDEELRHARVQVDYWLRRMKMQENLDAENLLKVIDEYLRVESQMPGATPNPFPVGSDGCIINLMKYFLEHRCLSNFTALFFETIWALEGNANKEHIDKKQEKA